jgi:hypothetical protein
VTLPLPRSYLTLVLHVPKKSRMNFLPLPIVFISFISEMSLLYFWLGLFTSSSVDPLRACSWHVTGVEVWAKQRLTMQRDRKKRDTKKDGAQEKVDLGADWRMFEEKEDQNFCSSPSFIRTNKLSSFCFRESLVRIPSKANLFRVSHPFPLQYDNSATLLAAQS